MGKFLTFLAVLILPFPLCAMTPLTESDLSNVSNPLSLSINIEQIIKTTNKPNSSDSSESLSQLLPTSSGLMLHFDVNLFEDPDETAERYATNKQFSSFPWLGGNNNILNNVQIFMIDPATGKDWTTLFYEDAIFNQYQIFSINPSFWKNYFTTINGKAVNAEDINNETYNYTQTTDTPTIPYSYPKDDTHSSNSPLSYPIMSGNTEMRDTYINNTSTTIQTGSWLNIRSH